MARSWWPGAIALLGLVLVLPAEGWAALLATPPPKVAARLVALDTISEEHQQAVEDLLGSNPLLIRIGTGPFRTTARVYDYLLERLPLAATLSRTLELGPYVVESTGPGAYWSTDQRGLEGTFKELVAADGQRVYLAKGRYDGRWLQGVTGRAIIVVRYGPTALGDGATAVENTVHCLVRFDNPFLQGMARIIGSVLQGLMEGKLRRAIGSAKALSELMASDPQAVYRAISSASSVTQAERAEFARWFL